MCLPEVLQVPPAKGVRSAFLQKKLHEMQETPVPKYEGVVYTA
jgi:hypothetical protein